MALIKCRECDKEISDTSSECVHCGCPLSNVIFYTSGTWAGLATKFIISDSSGKVLAKLKAGKQYETLIDEDTKFYVRCNTTLSRKNVEVVAFLGKINKFMVDITAMGGGIKISKID